MDEARRKRLHSILGLALELEAHERAAFLEAECAGDPELRKRAGELLALASQGDSSFLEPPDVPIAEEEPLHQVGDFEILRELGRGGMAVVFLARQERLGREVALKVLVTNAGTPASTIERFHREAQAVAGLRHPGIVQVFADGLAGTTHWFAMEYVAGHDLHTELEIQRGPRRPGGEPNFLPLPGEPDHIATIARLCRDVAEALHEAHQKGLVHRDVKPANLLLQPDGRVLVSDFGLVRDESKGTLTAPDALLGTPHYMSPEQAHVQEAKVDHRTDIYSLGVILYELATLRRPYEGKTSADILRRIKDGFPRSLRAINPRIPRDLETICTVAMSADPRARYQSASDLAQDLDRFLRHEAILARPPSWVDRSRRALLRHRRSLLVVLALVSGAYFGRLYQEVLGANKGRGVLAVKAVDARGENARARVIGQRLNLTTTQPGEILALGVTPFVGALDPGYYRITVAPGTSQRRTFSRVIEPDLRCELSAVLEPRLLEGMTLVRGGRLRIDEPGHTLLPLNHREIDIEDLLIDRTEVSIREYRRFLEDTQRDPPGHWNQLSPQLHDDLPITNISWEDAQAYAEWNGKRLPTLAEWMWVARGPSLRYYPWGSSSILRGSTAAPRVASVTLAEYLEHAAGVATYPEASTPEGIHHLFGNVGEMTESMLVQRVGDDFVPRHGFRFYAGCFWDAGARGNTLSDAFAHIGIESSYAEFETGFRCAANPLPEE